MSSSPELGPAAARGSQPAGARPEPVLRSQAGAGDEDEAFPLQPGAWYFCQRCDTLQTLPVCEICQTFQRDFGPPPQERDPA